MTISNKQRVFIEEYLTCWNASEAAKRAGYAHANHQATRLLSNVGIQEEIKRRIDEKAMSADEVLLRLADMARGDIGDFMDIESMSFDLDLKKAKEKGLTHLIKKARQRTVTSSKAQGQEEEETNIIELELYDAQAALVTLGKHLGVFKEDNPPKDVNIIVTLGDKKND